MGCLIVSGLLTVVLLMWMGIPSLVDEQETVVSSEAGRETETDQDQTVPEEVRARQDWDRLRVGVEVPVVAKKAQAADDADEDAGHGKKNNDEQKEKGFVMETVEDDYFSDALFIGDSRTVGMEQSGLLPDASYYAKTGIGIGEILETAIVYEGGMMLTIPQALKQHSFGKVYIMIGINDMSRGGVDWFIEKYQEILDVVRETQPEAIIYIQGNIPMAYYQQEEEISEGSLTNANLRKRNEASKELADDQTIFYLEIQDIYSDGYGNLNTIYTNDGLHVKSDNYDMWVDYLKQHAMVWNE